MGSHTGTVLPIVSAGIHAGAGTDDGFAGTFDAAAFDRRPVGHRDSTSVGSGYAHALAGGGSVCAHFIRHGLAVSRMAFAGTLEESAAVTFPTTLFDVQLFYYPVGDLFPDLDCAGGYFQRTFDATGCKSRGSRIATQAEDACGAGQHSLRGGHELRGDRLGDVNLTTLAVDDLWFSFCGGTADFGDVTDDCNCCAAGADRAVRPCTTEAAFARSGETAAGFYYVVGVFRFFAIVDHLVG